MYGYIFPRFRVIIIVTGFLISESFYYVCTSLVNDAYASKQHALTSKRLRN